MLLNRIETAMMNNPIRAALQRHYEARRLLALGGRVAGGHCLEIGCGRGIGVGVLFERFGAGRVDAFDLDPKMVARARRRLRRFGDLVRVWEGDATCIEADDDSYDAVFDFGIVHHIPSWRSAIAETFRVLKPGGRFYAEEVFESFIGHPFWRRVLDHPQEDRFDGAGFTDELVAAGLKVVATSELWGQFGWFVADKPA